MVANTILDGRARFGCSLEQFYQRTEMVGTLARLGVMLTLPIAVDPAAPPAYAYVNPLSPVEDVARWIANCPACPAGTAYVWLEGPLLMICVACGVTSPVVVPAERAAIEALLMARPVARRAWVPGESLDRLRAENALLGV